MGDLRPDNGGGWPPDDDGGPERLPGLPPEWGPVVIPDDPAELAEESSAIRRQLRRNARRNFFRRLFRRPTVRHVSRHIDESSVQSLATTIVIMAIAVTTTLVSLFLITWDHNQNIPGSQGSGSGSGSGSRQSSATVEDPTFVDQKGGLVRISAALPAVIVFATDCRCADLIAKIADGVPADVSVIAVAAVAPPLVRPAANTRAIADPQGLLRSRYAPKIAIVKDRPTVLIIDRSRIVTAIPAAATANDVLSRLVVLRPTETPTD